ncbi:hypothetical protein ANN_12997 [Periplaneta americana]|uniref:Transposase n=1 Tax=Periplaneta americana TaxID=6978 RepID=A0ABQ8TK10_PERAM|nr:hypothetical protein ANN_12997 [Periplaneta americana]
MIHQKTLTYNSQYRNCNPLSNTQGYRLDLKVKSFAVWWLHTEGLLLVDIMPHGTAINFDGYVATLKKLQVRLSRVRRHREKQDVLLLNDNAQPYVSHKTTDQIRKFG